MRLGIVLVAPVALFASGSGSGETDIIERVINFGIFAAILYYLVADKAVKFFKDRSLGISADLEKAQNRLKESKKLKDEALAKLAMAKREAEEIVKDAKREAEIISAKIKESVKADLEMMEKHASDSMSLERRKVQKSVVKEVLEELFSDSSASINDKNLSQIVLKKVA